MATIIGLEVSMGQLETINFVDAIESALDSVRKGDMTVARRELVFIRGTIERNLKHREEEAVMLV